MNISEMTTGNLGLLNPRPAALAAPRQVSSNSATIEVSTLRVLNMPTLEMDPRLQLASIKARTGTPRTVTSSARASEVVVIARVRDAEAFESQSDVTAGARIGRDTDGCELVTARIPANRIESVRQHPSVVSLKGSQPVLPRLATTTHHIGVDPGQLPVNTKPNGGAGVIVGIVDFGGDFAHQNFRKKNGKTRLLGLWNQGGTARPDSPLRYGRVYTRTEIDAALAQSNPYQALDYSPGVVAHGTHVMDIAAGNGLGSGVAGMAPKADLLFVELKASDVPWQGHEGVNRYFGDSVQLVEAVNWIFSQAGDRPCVVNLSLGTNGGPHDGTSLVESALDILVSAKPNRCVVIAAANSQGDNIHTHGTIDANSSVDLIWRRSSQMESEVEVWFAGDARLNVDLVAPDGQIVASVPPGQTVPLESHGQVAVLICNRLNDPNNGDNLIDIWLHAQMPVGDWVVRLTSAAAPVPFHAWIERFDRGQSQFLNETPSHTLGSISTGRHSIVVGSFDAHKAGEPISWFSSAGPTRDGREKPEVSAPGHDVVAAASLTENGVRRDSGTSMAAPAVTGLVALMLAEAKRQKTALSIAQIRERLISGVANNPPAAGWHDRYGYGRATSAAII